MLRVGQDVVTATARFLYIDTISLSRLGSRLCYQSWLSASFFGSCIKSGGISFTFLLRGLLIGYDLRACLVYDRARFQMYALRPYLYLFLEQLQVE